VIPIRLALLISLAMAAPLVHALEEATPRQAEVRQRGAEVMPFSIHDSLHVFEKTTDGGLQRVEARPGHGEQVAAIRAHLGEIAAQFTARDFSAPAKIHGQDMPGLAELRAAPADALAVVYRELPDGAELRYSATTASLRDALHRWFDAQLSDHGHDASDHHAHHAQHPPG